MENNEVVQNNWSEAMRTLKPFCLTPSAYQKLENLFRASARTNSAARLKNSLETLRYRLQKNKEGEFIKVVYMESFIDEILRQNQFDE